ncbi:MAG: hypothetical protein JWM27_355 [Gemmatimonadetes bacterium]|nr:hypothetical protein [Gemmatimonadota bacterium]
MAEIKVERKRRSVLPWVLGILALAVIAFVVFRVFGGDGGPGNVVAGGDSTVVVDTARP